MKENEMTRGEKIFTIATVAIFTFFISVLGVWAGRILLSNIGPTNSTSRVTQAAGGANIRNCLTQVDVTSDAYFIFRILDGSTTAYMVPISSGGALVRDWSELPFCGTANTVLELTVSAGNYNINYTGFTAQ